MPFLKEEIEKVMQEAEAKGRSSKSPSNINSTEISVPFSPQKSYSFFDKLLCLIGTWNYFFWTGIAVARGKCKPKDYWQFSENIDRGKVKAKIKEVYKPPSKNTFKVKDLAPAPQIDLLKH